MCHTGAAVRRSARAEASRGEGGASGEGPVEAGAEGVVDTVLSFSNRTLERRRAIEGNGANVDNEEWRIPEGRDEGMANDTGMI